MRYFAVFFALVASQAMAGVRIDLTVAGETGASEQRMQLQGDKLRVDYTNKGETRTMIFDGTQVVSFDGRSSNYLVIDPAQIKMQSEALKQKEAQLPPDAKRQEEQLNQVTFRKGAGGETMLGFNCSNYTELRGGKEHGTVCVVNWKTAPVKREDLRALSKFSAMMLTSAFAKKDLLLDPDDWPGFPLSMRFSDGKSLRLTSVTRGDIPDGEFQPPAGYTRKMLPTASHGGSIKPPGSVP